MQAWVLVVRVFDLCVWISGAPTVQHAKITTSMLWWISVLLQWRHAKEVQQWEEPNRQICGCDSMEHIYSSSFNFWYFSFQPNSWGDSSCFSRLPKCSTWAGSYLNHPHPNLSLPFSLSVLTLCLVNLLQISHHPPVSALHATDEKENLEMLWCQQPKAKFYGTS